MKRLGYFIFMIVLFMFFSINVEAKTRCVYNYNDVKFVLETTDNEKVLDKVSEKSDNWIEFKIYNKKTITLKNGDCPTVSFFDNNYYRRIYSSKSEYVNDSPRTGGGRSCSGPVQGVKDVSGKSTNGILEGIEDSYQFDLVSTNSNSCGYYVEYPMLNVDSILTANAIGELVFGKDDAYTYNKISLSIKKDGNDLKYSCTCDPKTDSCRPNADDSVTEAILNNGNFTCPKYIYILIM